MSPAGREPGGVFARLELRALRVYFGRDAALRGVDLDLGRRELTLLLGPNGSGKTTLLRCLAGLQRLSAGSIHGVTSEDRRVDDAAWRGSIGYVSHDLMTYPELTGRENLTFFSRLYGVGPDVVEDGLRRVSLVDAADKPVAAYSRGMRQRLSVARALVGDPGVLLLDEPFTGIDRDGRAALWELFAALRDEGRLVVVSTHDLVVPDGVVDRAVVLNKGRVRADERAPTDVIALYRGAIRAPAATSANGVGAVEAVESP